MVAQDSHTLAKKPCRLSNCLIFLRQSLHLSLIFSLMASTAGASSRLCGLLSLPHQA